MLGFVSMVRFLFVVRVCTANEDDEIQVGNLWLKTIGEILNPDDNGDPSGIN